MDRTRGQGDDVGIIGRTMFGIFLDVTGLQAGGRRARASCGEMSHRVKNVLAIATGLTAITSRSAIDTRRHGTRVDGAAHRARPRP